MSTRQKGRNTGSARSPGAAQIDSATLKARHENRPTGSARALTMTERRRTTSSHLATALRAKLRMLKGS